MAGLDIEALFRRYQKELRRFLRSRLGAHHSAADDLMQESFVRLQALDGRQAVRDERSFLFTVAANLSTDHMRTEGRRRALLGGFVSTSATDREEITPEAVTEGRSNLLWVKKELANMPARQRCVLLHHHLDGMTQREIARELGIGLTTVRTDLKLAISSLVAARRRLNRR
ncbi:MAG: RNA polymerase sigma factor [Pseudomonadota bacterium]